MRLDLDVDLECLQRRVARGATVTGLRDAAGELLELCAALREERDRWMALCHESDVTGSIIDEARKLAEKRAENCKTILVAQEQTIRALSHKLERVRDVARIVADAIEVRMDPHPCRGAWCPVCCPRQLIGELRCAVKESQ